MSSETITGCIIGGVVGLVVLAFLAYTSPPSSPPPPVALAVIFVFFGGAVGEAIGNRRKNKGD